LNGRDGLRPDGAGHPTLAASYRRLVGPL